MADSAVKKMTADAAAACFAEFAANNGLSGAAEISDSVNGLLYKSGSFARVGSINAEASSISAALAGLGADSLHLLTINGPDNADKSDWTLTESVNAQAIIMGENTAAHVIFKEDDPTTIMTIGKLGGSGVQFTTSQDVAVTLLGGDNDHVIAGAGNDHVYANGGANVIIFTGKGDDITTLQGDGSVRVYCGPGDDIIELKSTALSGAFDGGTGIDVIAADANGQYILAGNSPFTFTNINLVVFGDASDGINYSDDLVVIANSANERLAALLYQVVLGRSPLDDPDEGAENPLQGYKFWVEAFGAATGDELEHLINSFLDCHEVHAKYDGLDNEECVKTLFANLNARADSTCSAAGGHTIDEYIELLAHNEMDFMRVAALIAQSEEAASLLETAGYIVDSQKFQASSSDNDNSGASSSGEDISDSPESLAALISFLAENSGDATDLGATIGALDAESISGAINNEAIDYGYYKITLAANGNVNNHIRLDSANSSANPDLILFDGEFNILTYSSGAESSVKYISLEECAAGDYYCLVIADDTQTSVPFDYTLRWDADADIYCQSSEFLFGANGDIYAYVLGIENLTFADFADLGKGTYEYTETAETNVIDAEKSYYQADEYLCWAATAANMLEWTGWGEAGLENYGLADDYLVYAEMDKGEDYIFSQYIENFNDAGSQINNALLWFFDGTYNATSAMPASGSGNYLGLPISEYAKAFYTEDNNITFAAMERIAEYLRQGAAIGISGDYMDHVDGEFNILNSGHAITCWGFTYDLTRAGEPGYYTGLIVSDSDNDAFLDQLSYIDDVTDIADTLAVLPIIWDETLGSYYIPGANYITRYAASVDEAELTSSPYDFKLSNIFALLENRELKYGDAANIFISDASQETGEAAAETTSGLELLGVAALNIDNPSA